MCYWLEERDKAWKYARTHGTFFHSFSFLFPFFFLCFVSPVSTLASLLRSIFHVPFLSGRTGRGGEVNKLPDNWALPFPKSTTEVLRVLLDYKAEFILLLLFFPTKNVLQNPTITKEISQSLHALSRHKLVPCKQQKLLFPCVEDALIACQ